MLNLAVILIAVGIVLLAAEVFMPGFGIVGGLGIVSLVVAAVIMLFFVPFGIFFVVGEVVLVGFGIFLFAKFASKFGFLKKLVLEETLDRSSVMIVDTAIFVGKTGRVLTPLRPVGTVDFGGNALEAYSEGTFIEIGRQVVVACIQNQKILVKPAHETECSDMDRHN